MITTSINRQFRLQYLGVALLISAMGAYFVYDGAVGYPRKNEKHAGFVAALEALEKTKAEAEEPMPSAKDWMKPDDNGERHIDRFARDAGVKMTTKQIAEIRGVEERVGDVLKAEPDAKKAAAAIAVLEMNLLEKLKEPPYSQTDLTTQFWFAVIFFLFAAGVAGLVALKARVKFAADAEGLSRNSERVAWTEFSSADLARWHEKGIARLNFKGRAWLLDEWHYSGVKEIVGLMLEKRGDFTMPEKPAKE